MARIPGTDGEKADAALTPGPGATPATPAAGAGPGPRILVPGSPLAPIAASLTTPAPVSTGLHAPALTPGPVVQSFVTLGRYQLLSRLAVGGMAEVYLARQGELSGFKTLVVVKKVLPHLALNPEFIAMFLDEARIASMLNHPNVVRITEVGRAGDEYFLAMELVQGMPLTSVIRHGEKTKTFLPNNLAALIVANAAAGLHHAHQLTDAAGNLLGLVHRDVSPHNIMVSFEGSVKVIDFGIARALGRLGDTNSGSLKGKLGYMAPEQARGEPVDARADIFSLGVVLWESLAARRLFLRDNELATLRAVVYDPIPSVSDFANVDPALETIVMQALARDRAERFQTAEEIRVALEKWVFASGGASTHDLAALMKSWFAGDHLQWQRASRLALDMQETDPPMDMAFPNLAGPKSDASKAGSDTAPAFADTSSRAFKPVVPTPGAAQVVRPQLWRRALVPGAVGLAVLVTALWFGLSSGKKGAALPPGGAALAPGIGPRVQALPGPPRGLGTPAVSRPASKPTEMAAPSSHVGEIPPSPGAESASELLKRRNRGSSVEKRAILDPQNVTKAGSQRGKISADRKNAGSKRSPPRPNPF